MLWGLIMKALQSLTSLKDIWAFNIRGDLLAGLVVALALIPEAVAFSIIAGVDPKVGLYASFSIAVITAFAGGRPGMISAATATTAVLMVTLVKDHGLQYLLATTVLAGLLQIGAGLDLDFPPGSRHSFSCSRVRTRCGC
jgi:SulP family sulfate permease